MATQIFVNLPVKDLPKSKEFFTKLGFNFNPQFTDENAACLILGENIYTMLLTEPFFRKFTKKELVDAKEKTEAIISIDAGCREDVDALIQKALTAGGTTYMDPMDFGWMYGHSFADLDGHQWEVLYMDINAMPKKNE